MYCQIFNLDAYFKQTQCHYYLFDGLFLLEERTKEEIFNELDIISSSYRSQRAKINTVKTNINLLLKYFNYGDICSCEQDEYERLLSKIYYCCYFKQIDRLKEHLDLLNSKINENNVLRPVLVLFRVMICSSLDYDYPILKESLEEDLNYLILFYNKKYFKNELEFICLIFLFFFDKVEVDDKLYNKLDNFSISYHNLSWLRYYLQASKAYLKKDNINALINYEYVLHEFRRTNNLDRYFFVVGNVAGIYNVLGSYHLSYNVTSSVFEYVFSDVKAEKRARNILMHYLFSNLMLGRYDEIIEFFTATIYDYNCLSPISASIGLIAADKTGNLDKFNDILSFEFDNHNFNIIVSYLKSRDKTVLDDLIEYPYYKKIKQLIY